MFKVINKDMKIPLIGLFVVSLQGLIEKNSLGVVNVNMSTTRYVLGYYTLYRLLTFRSKLDINLLFLFSITILIIAIH